MSIAATVGLPIITAIPACIHDGFVAFERLKHVDQTYLLYVLKSLEDELRGAGQTGSQSNVNTAIVKGFTINLPPQPEQRRIAEALRDADHQIEALKRLIAKKEAFRQGTMQHLFCVEANPGDVAELGSVTAWLSGGTPDRANEHYWTGTIPWISATTLKTLEVDSSDQALTLDGVKAGSTMAPVGSTLLLVRGSALHNEIRASLVTSSLCFNQDVKALVPSARLVPKFLTHSLHGNAQRLLRLVTSAGNTAGVLDTRVVKGLEIWVPDKAEQHRVLAIMDDASRELQALRKRLIKATAIKHGIMQELLTGRARLPAMEKAAV